ncbi:MAG: helicase-related protein, partial [Bradyrhizobium sp.]|nr:helicase-related protein [Bradyrhizobium sp.]
QIAADLERGHVFTDRILHRRGRDETLLLGAATMRPIIERLLPGASIVTRPRLSQLEFSGDRKLTRQPRRTAIVAFSADEVYAIAELIKRQHGGAAVVLGSLSPRTRNAQVAMFQSGDVDYLVATDAVGMGLNLDVDHVAFASDRKYDGYQFRRLNPSEFAQIAGRAGRATRDGTFGTTGRCAPFEPELVNALQNHSFESVKVLQWRTSKLDFSSLGSLQVSLALSPTHDALTRAPIAEDLRVLDHAARDADVREMAHGAAAVERLWDACQIPDYRKIAPAAHAELVTTLFGFLMKKGRIPDAWFAAQVDQADRVTGDVMGMLGTVINSLALGDAIEQAGAPVKVFTNVPMPTVADTFTARDATAALADGYVVVCAGGTGSPFFTTDTAAALKAIELRCDVLLKGTKVDGVYSEDPKKNPKAQRFETISHE